MSEEASTIDCFAAWDPEAEAETATALKEVGYDHRISSACDACPARCCTQKFGFAAINLTREEQENPLFAPYLNSNGGFELEGRHCRFLDAATHRCSIYEQRPIACRGFVCHDTKNQGRNTLAMVYRDRELKAHLEREGVLPQLTEDLYWAENPQRIPTGTTGESNMYRPNAFTAGTWRFYKLEAATGNVVFEGRRRSTRESDERSPIRQMLDKKIMDRMCVSIRPPLQMPTNPLRNLLSRTIDAITAEIDGEMDEHPELAAINEELSAEYERMLLYDEKVAVGYYHEFVVTVTGCNAEEAVRVMTERVNHEEDYGFSYSMSCRPMDLAVSEILTDSKETA